VARASAHTVVLVPQATPPAAAVRRVAGKPACASHFRVGNRVHGLALIPGMARTKSG